MASTRPYVRKKAVLLMYKIFLKVSLKKICHQIGIHSLMYQIDLVNIIINTGPVGKNEAIFVQNFPETSQSRYKQPVNDSVA